MSFMLFIKILLYKIQQRIQIVELFNKKIRLIYWKYKYDS